MIIFGLFASDFTATKVPLLAKTNQNRGPWSQGVGFHHRLYPPFCMTSVVVLHSLTKTSPLKGIRPAILPVRSKSDNAGEF